MSRRRQRPFRHDYLDFDALTRQLEAWAEAHPQHARLQSLGESPEGRPIWLLSVGPADGSPRPAVWVDGNMHAGEVSGSSVALAIAEAALALHAAGPGLPDLPQPVLEAAREVTFHILPRLSPDGAETVLRTGRYVRSVPRDQRRHASRPRWLARDIDGDGLALSMRVEDPAGDYVESATVPGLMRLREVDDGGPFYRLYPEGVIEPFDGHTLPAPDFLGDNHPDLNRNFPWQWAPEERQAGAGPYPLSEPESRAVAAFVEDHPEIFAWLNLHTFGGVFVRPVSRCAAISPTTPTSSAAAWRWSVSSGTCSASWASRAASPSSTTTRTWRLPTWRPSGAGTDATTAGASSSPGGPCAIRSWVPWRWAAGIPASGSATRPTRRCPGCATPWPPCGCASVRSARACASGNRWSPRSATALTGSR